MGGWRHDAAVAGCALGHGADKDVTWVDGALDGSIVYVETEERLMADDDNTRTDAYRVQPPEPGEILPSSAAPRRMPAAP